MERGNVPIGEVHRVGVTAGPSFDGILRRRDRRSKAKSCLESGKDSQGPSKQRRHVVDRVAIVQEL
jgi:hypothetical protein